MIKWLTAIERAIIAGLVAVITCLTFIQVVFRYGFNQPLQWSEEVARYCFVWVTFLGAAALLRMRDGHPAIDSFYQLVNQKFRYLLDVISSVFVIAACVAIAIGCARLIYLQSYQLSPALDIPKKWIYLSMIVGPLISIGWIILCMRKGYIEDDT